MSDSLESKFEQVTINFLNFASSVAVLLESYATEPEENNGQSAQENWKRLVQLALTAGMTEHDIKIEIGTSRSTQYRWLHEDVRPRFQTRVIMAKAMADFLRQKYAFTGQPE